MERRPFWGERIARFFLRFHSEESLGKKNDLVAQRRSEVRLVYHRDPLNLTTAREWERLNRVQWDITEELNHRKQHPSFWGRWIVFRRENPIRAMAEELD